MNKILPSKRAWRWVPFILFVVLSASALSGCAKNRQGASSSAMDSNQSSSSADKTSADKTNTSKTSADARKSTPKTDRPYINQLLPEAQRIQQEFDIPVETTLAIAIHETGWGKFEIGKNNHFGLRCASDDCITLNKNGAKISYETCPEKSECFNMFARSLTELSNGQPSDLRIIYKNGYATSPSWVRKVRRIRRQVRKTLKEAGVNNQE